MIAEKLIVSGMVPDAVIRHFIRRRLSQKLDEEKKHPNPTERKKKFFEELRESPIALHTEAANEQHYELPPDFFQLVLGDHLKYSCGYWEDSTISLDQSEREMLDLYLERAQIQEGQSVLDLGCGWGSLSLYLAERFPTCQVLAVSNSAPQRAFIEGRMAAKGLKNLRVITQDANKLMLEEKFDRVLSIEMFEHMRNYKELFSRIASWLKPDGLLFVHIFCHMKYPYPFTHEGKNDWMGRYFFTGGIMPSADLFEHFQEDMVVEKKWIVDGTHYEKTSNAWLKKMDHKRSLIEPVLKGTYGKDARKWWHYWRIFFMACAELFGYQKGSEWCVGHYLFRKKAG